MSKKYQINVYNWNTGRMESETVSASERRYFAKQEMEHAISQKYNNPALLSENDFPVQYTLFIDGEKAVSIAQKLCNGYCYTQFYGGQMEAVLDNLVAISFFPTRAMAYKAAKIAKQIFKSPVEMMEEKDFVLDTPEYGLVISTKQNVILTM